MVNGEEHIICFISRRLHGAEFNHTTVEKELLAVVYALQKLHKYLLDREFTLYTDNNALKYLFNKQDISGRTARWILQLQEFQFPTIHIPGKENITVDVLSQFPVKSQSSDDGELTYPEASFAIREESLEENYEPFLNDIVKAKMYVHLPRDLQDQKKVVQNLSR
jgi:hypothetical protein